MLFYSFGLCNNFLLKYHIMTTVLILIQFMYYLIFEVLIQPCQSERLQTYLTY